MIVSFHNEAKNTDQVLPIIFDDSVSGKFKVPLYYKTCKQLLDLGDITGIIIPDSIDDKYPKNDYSPIELIKHLRLLDNLQIAKLPIFVPGLSDANMDQLNVALLIGIEDKEYETGANCLTDKELNTIVTSIDDDIVTHDITNKWAPYRLAQQLDKLGVSKIQPDSISELKENLLERYFFKKLIRKEKQVREESLNNEKTIIDVNEENQFKTKLKQISKQNLKVAIIDDDIESGWEIGYSSLFGKKNIKFLYPRLTKEESDNPEIREEKFKSFLSNIKSNNISLKKYDLIILDLRLYEKSSQDSSDILDIENISGIKILNTIKNHTPDMPVIMCTASNKSWSYDTAINMGAEGFWNKESPQYGMSLKYQFYNSYDLIETISKVVKWSSNIRPIYNAMDELASNIELENTPVAWSIRKKMDIVFSQLHITKSKFIENKFGQSSLVTAYLSICSIVNDVISFKRKQNGNLFMVDIDGTEEEFCTYVKDNNNRETYELTQSTIDCLKNNKYTPSLKSHLFPEKALINFLLEKSGFGNLRSKYGYLTKMRNNLDLIHSKPIIDTIDMMTDELELKHLYEMLNIFYVIFLDNKLNHRFIQ